MLIILRNLTLLTLDTFDFSFLVMGYIVKMINQSMSSDLEYPNGDVRESYVVSKL